MKNIIRTILTVATAAGLAMAAPQATQQDKKHSTSSTADTSTGSKTASKMATESEISDARTKGMVWANTNTKVYHKSDSSLYGKTKHGQFMTEDEATKAGYRASKEKSKHTKPSNTNTKPSGQ